MTRRTLFKNRNAENLPAFRAPLPYAILPRNRHGFYRTPRSLGATARPLPLPGVTSLTATISRTTSKRESFQVRRILVDFQDAATAQTVGYAEFAVYDCTVDSWSAQLLRWLDDETETADQVLQAAQHFWDDGLEFDDTAPGLQSLFTYGGAVAELEFFELKPGASRGQGKAALQVVLKTLVRRYRIGTVLVKPFPLQYAQMDAQQERIGVAAGPVVEQGVQTLRRYYASLLDTATLFWTNDGTLAMQLRAKPKKWFEG